MSESGKELKSYLFESLSRHSHPIFVFPEEISPAASIWSGSRIFVEFWREHDFPPGTPVILSLPPGVSFLQVLVGLIWVEAFVVLPPPDPASSLKAWQQFGGLWIGKDAIRENPDYRLELSDSLEIHTIPTSSSLPGIAGFAFQTSGTTGEKKWILLSQKNLLAVTESHQTKLQWQNARIYSILPWHHIFGFTFDLLFGLFFSDVLVRDNPDSPVRILQKIQSSEITHWNCVPGLMERVLDVDSSGLLLEQIQGGILGGAKMNAALAERLRGSRFRIGYGQTEASPGICLGKEGEFEDSFIGAPLGCEIRINQEGELEFKGDNAYLGTFQNGIFAPRESEWVDTKDKVESRSNRLYYRGRSELDFKLPNGTRFETSLWESILQTALGTERLLLTESSNGKMILLLNKDLESDIGIREKLEKKMAGLARYLDSIQFIAAEQFLKTPKGEWDRKRILESILRSDSPLPKK